MVGFETASTSDTITLNGSTTGGLTWKNHNLHSYWCKQWGVQVTSGCTGDLATPFSAAVS